MKNKLLRSLTSKNKNVTWLHKLNTHPAVDLNSEISKEDLILAYHLYK